MNGWQTATGQSINNTQLVKVTNQISSVTPGNPAGGGTVVTGTPTISSLGTNTGLSYNFTTAFSGFGAGVAGTVLSIDLLSFQGQLNNNNLVLLNWSTSSEENSKGFDVERSYDGVQFTKIGYIPAAGNSSTEKDYSFTDPNLPQENNYYRLKKIDIDGNYAYSKVVMVRDPANNSFKVLNNPFTSYLDLQFGKPVTGNAQIRLMDITGREMFRYMPEVNGLTNLRIDLSQKPLSAGVYILEVLYNDEKHVARVVKQ
ncbi:MAG TPA: T9SS type A sorting domain-containing protein [Puia sp.]|nr:T9SS type A sorting domain-containing protein [Puia sp.]